MLVSGSVSVLCLTFFFPLDGLSSQGIRPHPFNVLRINKNFGWHWSFSRSEGGRPLNFWGLDIISRKNEVSTFITKSFGWCIDFGVSLKPTLIAHNFSDGHRYPNEENCFFVAYTSFAKVAKVTGPDLFSTSRSFRHLVNPGSPKTIK